MRRPPPRWRVRRTPTGSWAVYLRVHLRTGHYAYAPMGTWPTWPDAMTWMERAAAANDGRRAA